LADERAEAVSPLHRVNPDMGSRTYHGIRMIAEDRSRFAIRPFESAKGRLLFEVYPEAVIRRLDVPVEGGEADKRKRIVAAMESLQHWPVKMSPRHRARCMESGDALDAVVAARCAAVAVLTEEADKSPEQLDPEHSERVRFEGWIYGLHEAG
jgi:hypothetical protein